MGQAKDAMMQAALDDPKNWTTKTCTHCGAKYKVNEAAGVNVNENGWCPDCREKIENMVK
jgi:hypothetical protein